MIRQIFPSRHVAALALALATASPAAAQQGCGTGTAGSWIGGTRAESDIAAAQEARQQLALALTGAGHLSVFRLSRPASVRLEATARRDGDPVIELLDEGGTRLAEDDDGGGGTSSFLQADLAPGLYCLRTTNYEAGPLSARVRIGLLWHQPLTSGAGPAVPRPATPEEPATPDPPGRVAEPVDPSRAETPCEDAPGLAEGSVNGLLAEGVSVTAPVIGTRAYRFTLEAPAALSLSAENEEADPVLTLLSASGEVIAENDDADGYNARIDLAAPLAAGDYCVALQALADDRLPITLTLSAYDAQSASETLYARAEAAPPLDGSYPITELGALEAPALTEVRVETTDAQWFSLRVRESGLLLLEAAGTAGSDPALALFDAVGRPVLQNDDYGTGYDSLIAARVFPGQYLVALREISGTPGRLRLSAQRFVPAD